MYPKSLNDCNIDMEDQELSNELLVTKKTKLKKYSVWKFSEKKNIDATGSYEKEIKISH